MPHEVLAVFLRDIDDVAAVLGDACPAGEVLGVGEQAAPLRLEQVDHIEVFAVRFQVSAVRGQEVDMGVPAEPPPRVHVYPALDAQFQPLLARLDSHLRPQRFVLEAACHINDDIPARQPALTATVNISVCDLPHPHIAAHVNMPCVEVRVNLVVMAVRLVGYPFRRPEVDAARHRSAGVVVHNRYLHPVAPPVEQLDARPRSLSLALLFNLPPGQVRDSLAVLLDGHGCRWNRRYLSV